MSKDNMNIVKLNVYDLNEMNETTYLFGFGAFHSGVEIFGREYTFAKGGIFYTPPKEVPPPAKFRESIEMGVFNSNPRDLDYLLDELRNEFKGDDYHIVFRNCNHFADAFVQKLLQREIPGYVNRLAYVGSMFSCLMPPSLLDQNPIDASNTSNSISNNRRITNTTSHPFTSKGNTLGGSTVDTQDKKELIRLATLNRMQVDRK